MPNSTKNVTENESDDKVENSSDESEEKSNLKGDYGNIAILLLLYVLQGDKRVILTTSEH